MYDAAALRSFTSKKSEDSVPQPQPSDDNPYPLYKQLHEGVRYSYVHDQNNPIMPLANPAGLMEFNDNTLWLLSKIVGEMAANVTSFFSEIDVVPECVQHDPPDTQPHMLHQFNCAANDSVRSTARPVVSPHSKYVT